MAYRLFIGVEMLNENEVLDIMKNDLYQANERIKELELSNEKMLDCMYSIYNMCIGDLTMGCKIDANAVGEEIFCATGMTIEQMRTLMEKK